MNFNNDPKGDHDETEVNIDNFLPVFFLAYAQHVFNRAQRMFEI